MLPIIKKEIKSSLILSISIILITGSLLQILSTSLFVNNDHTLIKISSIYAQDDDGGGDDGGDTPDFFGSNNANDDGDEGDEGNDGDGDGGNTPNDESNTANFFSSPSEGSNGGTTDSTSDQQGQTPVEPPVEPPNPFQLKIKYEFNFNIIDRTTNKIIVKDYNDIEKQIIIINDKINCPTQSDSVELTGKISPKGIRLLADFDPCRIVDGGVTLNIPNNPNLKLAAVYIDKNGNNHGGTLINPVKIQTISKNQGLFTIELDDTMKGINPVTGQTTTLTKINGLALYNNGDKPIQFKSGNIAALTTVFTK